MSAGAELKTIKEVQPLDDEFDDENASIRLQNRLFFATEGSISSLDTSQNPPSLLWTCPLNSYIKNEISMKLFGKIIVATSGGVLYRVDAEKGVVLGQFELTRNLESHYTCLAIHKNYALCNTTNRLYAIDRNRLRKVWKSSDFGERFDAVEIIGNRVCVASDSEVNIIDVETGQDVFSERFEGPRKAITLLKDDTTIPDRPVCFVGFCGKVYTIDLLNQKLMDIVFTVEEDQTFGVAMTLYRGLLIAASGGFVSAFETSTMKEVWAHQYGHETGYNFMNTVQAVRYDGLDYILVGCNGYLLAVDPKNGKQLWLTSLPRGGYQMVSSLFYDTHLYAASNGMIWGMDIKDGSVKWSQTFYKLGSQPMLLLSPESENQMSSDTPIIQSQGRTPAFKLFR